LKRDASLEIQSAVATTMTSECLKVSIQDGEWINFTAIVAQEERDKMQ
jgi:hypothetical protein